MRKEKKRKEKKMEDEKKERGKGGLWENERECQRL